MHADCGLAPQFDARMLVSDAHMDYVGVVAACDPLQVHREPEGGLFYVALHVNDRVSIFESHPEDVQPNGRDSNVQVPTVPHAEPVTSRMRRNQLVTAVRWWWTTVRSNDGGLVSLLTRDLPRRLWTDP